MSNTLTIRVDEQLKKEFLKNSKNNWFEASFLLRYFMMKYNENQEIIKLEVDGDIFDGIFKVPKINKSMEKLSGKLDEIWF